MPKKVEWYRQNAEKCQQLGHSFTNPEAQRAMFAMADSWLMLHSASRTLEAVLPGSQEQK